MHTKQVLYGAEPNKAEAERAEEKERRVGGDRTEERRTEKDGAGMNKGRDRKVVKVEGEEERGGSKRGEAEEQRTVMRLYEYERYKSYETLKGTGGEC